MGKVSGKYFISNKKRSCFICDRYTSRIEIKSEKRICCKKCEEEYYNNEHLRKILYLRIVSFDEENPLNSIEILDKIYLLNNNIYNILMKVREDNVLEAVITFLNNFNDIDFISCKSFDSIVENGNIVCFEKNKKTIKNKSKLYECFLNLELKLENSSFLKLQILECSQGDIDNHHQVHILSNKFN